MLIGPVFYRELAIAPRRPRLYLVRASYAAALAVLMATAWLVLTGTQFVRDVGDLARFGAILFQLVAPVQMALLGFFAVLLSASAVAQEKDRRTFVLLMLTHLTNSELVLGKLLASLLSILVMLAAALPIFLFVTLFGGVSLAQVGRVYLVTLATILVAGSLGSTIALWREKTFQALAVSILMIVAWVAAGELVASGLLGDTLAGAPVGAWAVSISPWRALMAASRPLVSDATIAGLSPLVMFVILSVATAMALNAIALRRVRAWHTTRDERQATQSQEAAATETIWAEPDAATNGEPTPASRAPRPAVAAAPTREVWDNPVLWREIRTWAYGRKMLLLRGAYLALFAGAAFAMHGIVQSDQLPAYGGGAVVLIPLMLLSFVLVNAQAVTSLTSERDTKSLDVLLVTDLTPHEIVFGKLGGVFYNVKEMVVLPMLLCAYLWWCDGITLENLVYLVGGAAVIYLFVAMLGIHAGIIYDNSLSATATSLGTVFFLFLGVATCMRIMVAFTGSFHAQLLPFAAMFFVGGLGLYLALGARNPSSAIALAAFACPFATFYAITSYLLGSTLGVFIVASAAYGFATAAMLIPALYEFDIASGRAD